MKKNKSILIILTGSSGFLGNYLYEKIKKKYNIILLKSSVLICNKKFIVPKNFKKTIVIHSAAATPTNSTLQNIKNINKKMIVSLNNLSKQLYNPIFINISSVSMFNGIKNGVLYNNSRYKPLDEFSQSKVFVEKYLQKNLKHYQKIFNLRLPGVIGKEANRNFMINLINKLSKGDSIKIYNPKSQFNNLVHVSQVTKIIISIINNDIIFRQKYVKLNLCSSDIITISNLVLYLKKKLKSNSIISHVKTKRKSFFIFRTKYLHDKRLLYSIKRNLNLYINEK